MERDAEENINRRKKEGEEKYYWLFGSFSSSEDDKEMDEREMAENKMNNDLVKATMEEVVEIINEMRKEANMNLEEYLSNLVNRKEGIRMGGESRKAIAIKQRALVNQISFGRLAQEYLEENKAKGRITKGEYYVEVKEEFEGKA